ncbi:hypothetical protein TVAG_064740 [Trichomonas vaginalis G3]|uniref:F5/8 type C domain-containing protein n=1 Tax=Trichomonas vaginalis (strain ATCC PRA-98 / G3) TaxID=412133 RepID=A2EHE8_TRIV3|nr:galactose-binding domain-like family [Trichomonas vaginalis G3]EAY07926.1 hypothetical protein TVAG_064740 [Trichomonas vaginalis G3]KAI5531238.1 galactose-binding domain-like family [Trichomonas vaginalis G3]|eukprot:XP_001320149.1 hypothetical protein [Trichomonas vaginalis G3]
MNCLLFLSLRESIKDGIFKKVFHENIISIDVSGSSQQDINGSMQVTKPEYSIYPWDKDYDWCSNCGKSYDEHPYISYSLKNKKLKIKGYFVRSGCCYIGCCCEEYGYCAKCCMYSWSLQISDDNKTWKEVHRVEKDYDMRRCREKTYNFDQEYECKYVRLIQNEACPGDPPCLAINKLDLLGDVIAEGVSDKEEFVSFHDDDDDVSIIGHISKNGNIKIV